MIARTSTYASLRSCPGRCLLTRACCQRQGNKDPPAASLALDHASEAAAQLAKLPEPFRSFYVSAARYALRARAAYADAARAVLGQARRAARELTGLVADADAAPDSAPTAATAATSAHETQAKLAPQGAEKDEGEARREVGKDAANEGSCAEDAVLWLAFVATVGALVVGGTRRRQR